MPHRISFKSLTRKTICVVDVPEKGNALTCLNFLREGYTGKIISIFLQWEEFFLLNVDLKNRFKNIDQKLILISIKKGAK